MTPQQREILELCEVLIAADEAATPGPWIREVASLKYGGDSYTITSHGMPFKNNMDEEVNNAIWIEVSRTAAPRLARKVKEMLGEE